MTDSCSIFILEIHVQNFSIILWLILEMNMNNIFFRLPKYSKTFKKIFQRKKALHFKIFFFKDTAFFRVLIEMFIFGKKYLVLNATSFGCDKTAESGFHRQSLLKKPRMSNKYTAQIFVVSRQFHKHWHIFCILLIINFGLIIKISIILQIMQNDTK